MLYRAFLTLVQGIKNIGLPKFKPRVTVSQDGVILELSRKETQTVAWNEIQEIKAYLGDLYTIDLFCIVLYTDTNQILEVHEDMQGYPQFLESLMQVFGDIDKNWSKELYAITVQSPPRLIWQRSQEKSK